MCKLILASSSPRRKELMGLIPVDFKIETKEVEESIDARLTPEENVKTLASKKAYAVAESFKEEWVLGCDTVVVHQNKILGKPKDASNAKEMLAALSGDKHEVYTGISLYHINKNIHIQCAVCSSVYMRNIEEAEMNWYIATGEPLDKAGAYGIQGYASNFIEKIEGDYFNIVGLPISTVYKILRSQGIINL
ncbi:Maf family protein [Niameybacter massiliensis]|uniref:Maf family protein n=1 Tax=Niameybacter massiliensis TaxID=1658108 RepID=UPI0006B568C6|nr:Maf family protein [Niameybacter massiliensis]